MTNSKIPTLSSINVKNKLVLLRSDLNSDVVNGKILASERIKSSSETIKELIKKGAKVVVLAHQGRKGNKDYTTLEQHAKQLNKYVKIKFVPDVTGVKARREILNLKNGDALLLDNVRSVDDEMKPKKKNNVLIKFFKEMNFDFYVNDAFSVSHREQTSVTELPKYFKSCVGRLMEKELNALERININSKNCLFILGGAKPEDNIKLLGKKNKVITGGIFGQVCTLVKGKNLGAQNKFLEKQIKDLSKIIGRIKPYTKSLETPSDFAVSKNKKRLELKLEQFPSPYEIFDIGEETMKRYVEEINKADAIYMKGPLGYCEEEKFSVGTVNILKAIAKRTKEKKLFSLIGGGHLTNAFARAKLNEKDFSHISLSGGALVSYLAGEKLPGIEVLKHKNVSK